MQSNYMHIVLVLDRSGSMQSIRDDTMGGVNRFLADQQAQPGRATFTLALFDDQHDVIHNHEEIANVRPLTVVDYVPRGWTALLDAIGRSINSTGTWLRMLPEDRRPGKVLFAIMTDGMENASKEFTREQINRMIEHQRDKYKWEFVYLGANQDAISVGNSYGIPMASSMTYAANAVGTANVMDSFTRMSGSLRAGHVKRFAFSNADRIAACAGVEEVPNGAAAAWDASNTDKSKDASA